MIIWQWYEWLCGDVTREKCCCENENCSLRQRDWGVAKASECSAVHIRSSEIYSLSWSLSWYLYYKLVISSVSSVFIKSDWLLDSVDNGNANKYCFCFPPSSSLGNTQLVCSRVDKIHLTFSLSKEWLMKDIANIKKCLPCYEKLQFVTIQNLCHELYPAHA